MITSYQWANDDNLAKSADQERHERYQRAMANLPEDQRGENPVVLPTVHSFIPDRDIVDTLPDGRCIIICHANMPMPIAEARRRRLVVDAPAVPEPAEPSTEDTPSDKRQAVLTALAQHPEWSDREIARQTGASNTFVGRLRKAGA